MREKIKSVDNKLNGGYNQMVHVFVRHLFLCKIKLVTEALYEI